MGIRLPQWGESAERCRLIQQGLRGEHQEDVNACKASLPNFIIIGAAKSATTTLTTILPRHPDFFISKPKEPKFFGRYYDKGWAWYGKLFRKGATKPFRGEASTMYASHLSSFEHTPQLIHRYLPDTKIIYIVRHPLDRIVSQWRHVKGRDSKAGNFEALLDSRHLRDLVVGCSLYYQHVNRYRQFFPDNQIHCMTFEDLIEKPRATLRSLLLFLGASPRAAKLLDHGRLPVVNEAGDKGREMVAKPEWTPKLKMRVTQVIAEDSQQMLAYMNKPSHYWEL